MVDRETDSKSLTRKEKGAIRSKRNRKRCLSKGVCTICWKGRIEKEGSVLCESCKDRRRKYQVEKIQTNKCTRCPAILPEGYRFVKCPKCREIDTERARQERNKRVEEGRCIRCGRPLIDIGQMNNSKTKCVNCLEYRPMW